MSMCAPGGRPISAMGLSWYQELSGEACFIFLLIRGFNANISISVTL